MRIANNITALNTYNSYTTNNKNIAGSVKKLSSGYQINSAADNAAGLAISEKMRAQIRGLNQASKNSQDAISMVQTAEGALQSTHDILQRMRELAVQSSSDTNQTEIDREAIQAEFKALQDEINEIATTTRYNNQNLLDGTYQSKISTLTTTGTDATTATNMNSISVARAKAGNYTMDVKTVAAIESKTTPGVACGIEANSLKDLAATSSLVSNVSFTGLETAAHNGNIYTLNVTGGALDKMTFQLIDTNGKVVSTAQNVDVTNWGSEKDDGSFTSGIVSFSGVGTFTFGMTGPVEYTTDLTNTLTGSKLTFGSGGDVTTATGGDVTASTGITAGTFTADSFVTAADGTYTITMAETTTGNYQLTATDADGNEIKSDEVAIADAFAGDSTFTIAGLGSLTITTDASFDNTSTLGIDGVTVATGPATATVTGGDVTASTGITAGTFTADSSAATGTYTITMAETTTGNYQLTATDADGNEIKSDEVAIADAFAGDSTFTIAGLGSLTITTDASFDNTSTLDIDPIDVTAAPAAGGKDPVTADAVRASLQLTMNGETVTLHKGDTYANFNDNGIAFNFDALSDKDIANANYFGNSATTPVTGSASVKIGVSNTNGTAMTIQTGANQGDELKINIDRMDTEYLGISFTNVATQDAASKAITEVNNAINQVSTQRAALGALQNRIEYKIDNLNTSAENLTSAESLIRDVDMASEMTKFTNANILQQAATAMLAQANALPQNVLSLLG